MLFYTAFVISFRVAFIESDSIFFIIFEYIIDFLFFLDLIFSFFTAYYDKEDNLIQNRSKIAWHYLHTWFLIDLISILPFGLLLQATGGTSKLSQLAKFPRLYKLVKLAKYFKQI